MIRFIYNLLFPIGLVFFLPGYLAKMMRRGNYRHKFGQRFALYDVEVRVRLARASRTWIHAVSVGEVAIALRLAAKLRELAPEFSCVLTTTTTTGFAFAEKSAPPWMEVLYNPIDFWPIMRRAFAVLRPERLILVEAEVWPNLVARARAKQIPVALCNARLSPRSERRFRKFRFFVAPTFRCLDLICVQEPEDVARWEALGVSRDRIECVGSIKFDPDVAEQNSPATLPALRDFGIEPDALILFGGSTHADEEEILARIFLELRAKFPSLRLLIAPRHVERAPEIQRQLEALGLRVSLRRAAAHAPADCLLIDTTGELRDWYAAASVVFIGKSLCGRGGQNPAEPILAGKPVIFGPHMENFAALAAALIDQKAARQIADATALRNEIENLLRDPAARARMVGQAHGILARHAGATEKTAALLLPLRARK